MNHALSVYLDLVRFLAAALVFVVHANYERLTGGLPVLWRLGDLGNDAVMAFFVLSGFVIAHVTREREKDGAVYFAARVSRLWSIGLPALAMTAVLDAAGIRLSPSVYDGWWHQADMPLLRVLANITFLNELWFLSIRPFSNGPYWSIGYEFWYYAIFGAIAFLHGKTRTMAVTLLLLFVGPKILILFPIWLLGVWAYSTSLPSKMTLSWAAALFISTLSAYLIFRSLGMAQALDGLVWRSLGADFIENYLQWSRYFASGHIVGLLIAVNFVAARAIVENRPGISFPLEPAIRWLAGFTFSLYLFHYPLLHFFAASADWLGVTEHRRIFVLVNSLGMVALIGSWAEGQKAPLRRLLLALHERTLRR